MQQLHINQKKGKLHITKYLDRDKWNVYWVCFCDCGNKSIRTAKYLLNNKTKIEKSCGCANTDWKIKRNKKCASQNGMSNSSEYMIWSQMKTRCYNKKHIYFHRYGGRGIKICNEWLGENGFKNFFRDMGTRPSKQVTLDRINLDGDYSKDNCRWANAETQANNRYNNIKFDLKGERLGLSQISRRYNINKETLYGYVKRNGFESAIQHFKL